MKERLRIGIIGCGGIGVATVRGIPGCERAEHLMVMDTDERLAADMGATCGVPWTGDTAELLANPNVDMEDSWRGGSGGKHPYPIRLAPRLAG